MVGKPLCDIRTPVGPNNLSLGHLMKIEWLVAHVTAVGSPGRAERDILGMVFGVSLANSGHFCDQGATL